jgi:hypothetical protein
MPYYAWRCEGVEGVLKADSKVRAAALAAKRLGAVGIREHPAVEELGENVYRVTSGDGRHVVVKLFHLGNRRPDGHRVLNPGQKEPHVLPERAALAVIRRYLAHGGTQEGADALWQLHERYRALYRGR